MQSMILVVEDQDPVAIPLIRTLELDGYQVQRAASGGEALTILAGPDDFDLVVLDLGLPDMSGLDVCKQARQSDFAGGIMMVTGQAEEIDIVIGLDFGADDYLAKPIRLAEFQARVRALLRRIEADESEENPTGLRIDSAARRVFVEGREIHLSGKEFGVLALLMANPGAVVSRENLMKGVWDGEWYGTSKALDVTIARLRKKLAEANIDERIIAVRGVGFRIEDKAAASVRAQR